MTTPTFEEWWATVEERLDAIEAKLAETARCIEDLKLQHRLDAILDSISPLETTCHVQLILAPIPLSHPGFGFIIHPQEEHTHGDQRVCKVECTWGEGGGASNTEEVITRTYLFAFSQNLGHLFLLTATGDLVTSVSADHFPVAPEDYTPKLVALGLGDGPIGEA